MWCCYGLAQSGLCRVLRPLVRLVFDWPQGPSCYALGQLLVGLRRFAASFGDCLLDCIWERIVLAPAAHLSFGSLVPNHAQCPVLMGRTVGVGPGSWIKTIQSNSIQCLSLLWSMDNCTHHLLSSSIFMSISTHSIAMLHCMLIYCCPVALASPASLAESSLK